ncbi:MAG: patatin-like phospholipase family protein [Burkholderiaceae bacterium]
MAGGGPLGAIYEIGALAALSESLDGLELNHADVYVGVSAGGIIAAGLVNGITPHQMSRLFIEGEKSADRFDPSMLLRPALGEYAKRLASIPPLAIAAAWNTLFGSSTLAALERLGRAIPTGLFSGEAIERYLSRIFTQPGRSNDFRTLGHRLFLVATDLDTGASVSFGAKGHDHIPISRAARASAALPGLFPPVEIEGHHFVDGALRKTLHASIALDHGVDLLLCLNPLVPYDSTPTPTPGRPDRARRMDRLIQGGLPVVLAQTFRSIIHSRLGAGLERYESAYPDTDIVLFEPARADADMFFTNMFSYSSRRELCEHAYQRTREDLWKRRHDLGPKLARHGITIRADVLSDQTKTLIAHRKKADARTGASAELSRTLDDLDRWMQAAAARS